MTLNLTQFYVEVAGQYTDGELRVYRQHASVLTLGEAPTGNTFNESINETLSLVDTVSNSLIHNVYDTLNITDNATVPVTHLITDTLNLSDSFTSLWLHNISVEDPISFTQSLQKALPASANNVLALSDADMYAQLILEDRKIVSNTLNFVQTTLTLSSIQMSDTLNFQQTVNVYNSSRPVFASNHVFFRQQMPTPFRMWIADEIALPSSNSDFEHH